jgi:type III pantothenate kinase
MQGKVIKPSEFLCLSVGNSRLHWAWFQGEKLFQSWDSDRIESDELTQKDFKEILPLSWRDRVSYLPIYLASVVDSQTILWQTFPQVNLITLKQIPLKAVYSSLGIDRALAVWGAGSVYGFPCLVIDAGTALTFTCVNSDLALYGGAILPGLKLQLQSLATKTAALPEVTLPESLPDRWSLNTQDAIASGVIYTVLAGIEHFSLAWLKEFPNGKIALTGGDGELLNKFLQICAPNLIAKIIFDPQLIFWGMRSLILSQP